MNGLPDAQAVLSAMITPAVLISACGSLIMATSGRLNRAVDRTRETSRRFAELAQRPAGEVALEEERRMLFSQLDLSSRLDFDPGRMRGIVTAKADAFGPGGRFSDCPNCGRARLLAASL